MSGEEATAPPTQTQTSRHVRDVALSEVDSRPGQGNHSPQPTRVPSSGMRASFTSENAAFGDEMGSRRMSADNFSQGAQPPFFGPTPINAVTPPASFWPAQFPQFGQNFPQFYPNWWNNQQVGFPPTANNFHPVPQATTHKQPKCTVTRQSSLAAPNPEEVEDQGEYSDCSVTNEGDQEWCSDDEETVTRSTKFSFAEKVALLQSVSPASVGVSTSCRNICTEADKIFGGPQEEKESVILLESEAVRAELLLAQAYARTQSQGDTSLSLGPKEVPDFPKALPCGKFLRTRQPPFPKKIAVEA